MEELREPDFYIISKEVGVTVRSRDSKERELEVALEKGYSLIVIEPRTLGDDVIRWIKLGNFLHKSSVLADLGALLLIPLVPHHVIKYTVIPIGMFGVWCTLFYNFSWQFDPCCKYQVDWNGQELSRIPSNELNTRSPVILVRRNDYYRKLLHSTLSVFVGSFLLWRLYKIYY